MMPVTAELAALVDRREDFGATKAELLSFGIPPAYFLQTTDQIAMALRDNYGDEWSPGVGVTVSGEGGSRQYAID